MYDVEKAEKSPNLNSWQTKGEKQSKVSRFDRQTKARERERESWLMYNRPACYPVHSRPPESSTEAKESPRARAHLPPFHQTQRSLVQHN